MYPSLLAEETKDAVTEYLATTFALADPQTRDALQEFLHDERYGIFKGPYLKLRTPFHHVGDDWASPLGWMPDWFTPFRHQARTFERLSTAGQASEPTIVTTGTGSGKTESFLLPLLDHARRAKQRGQGGIKALIMYPMNALVTDQATRVANMLHDEPELADVTAGVYIGGPGKQQHPTREALIDDRDILQAHPPDILLTNYKMLDLLLQRSQDAELWQQSATSLHYIVLDEFHTYDGAQGTDVAMLLRRLGATLGVAESGRPLGRITPVATSATLGGSSNSEELRDFAETVFGTEFDAGSVITEERRSADDIVGSIDFQLDLPDVDALASVNAAHAMDADDPDAWRPLAAAVFGKDKATAIADRVELGELLSQHFLTRLAIQTLAARPMTPAEAISAIASSGALKWGVSNQTDPAATQHALLAFLALISAAKTRGPGGREEPFLHVEAQLWLRELNRMLRAVAPEPAFAWWHDGVPDADRQWLPTAYCRSCGHSGWQAIWPELGTTLEGGPRRIWQASLIDRASVRTIMPVDENEPGARWLNTTTLETSTDKPEAAPNGGGHGNGTENTGASDVNASEETIDTEPGKAAWMPVAITPDSQAATDQRCPVCDTTNSVRFLGSAVATLASVTLNGTFGSRLIPDDEKKTLVFTDSVQDAAYRAAFIEGRAFAFNFRSLLYRALNGQATSLDVAVHRLTGSDPADLYSVAPPDFTRRLGLEGEWLTGAGASSAHSLLARRLAFQSQIEFGMRSRNGRTLELVGSITVDIDLDLAGAASFARETHANLPQLTLAELPDTASYQTWILGLLDRLRTRGGIAHEWLRSYRNDDGRRWTIWGRPPPGMQKFPAGRPAPIFYTTGTGSEFDSLKSKGESWLVNWTVRSLGLSQVEAKSLVPAVIDLLAEQSGVLDKIASKKGATTYGLRPEKLILEPVADAARADGTALAVCDHCGHLQPTPARLSHLWHRAACPRMNCPGHLEPQPVTADNFYRDLYESGRVRRIVTHEHTGLLERDERETVEHDFKTGGRPIDPNILTCTPTLELGIDIGDLSTVTLSSLPRATSNYLQRIGRAGRSNGNAFILATVPSRPRDLYYYAEPANLIDGVVRPPGAYLNATELLQRQFLAYCLDRVAADDLQVSGAMPHNLAGLFDEALGGGLTETSWLRSLLDAISAESGSLADDFIALFGKHIDNTSSAAIEYYAAGALASNVARAVDSWQRHRSNLNTRITELGRNIAELNEIGHLDDQQEADRRQWLGELKGLRQASQAMGEKPVHGGLTELGLLPNYSLMDDTTTLDVQLWWTSDDAGDNATGSSGAASEASFGSIEHSIARGSRTALTEMAPGAVFYAYGREVKIDAIDIGTSSSPEYFDMRLCPDCGWGTDNTAQRVTSCPHCGTGAVADTGACHTLLPLRRVTAVHHRDEAVVDDDAEDRKRTRFTTVTGVSVHPDNIVSAWRLADHAFGAEYIRSATVRTINAGQAGHSGEQVTIAGNTLAAPGFRTCTQCGVVADQPDVDKVKHRGWCPSRQSGGKPEWKQLLLSHELDTQAVRLLLPLSTLHVEAKLASFSAALQLGLRSDFGGDPQHLSTVTASLPDAEGRTRRFVVLHDLVPGGTGYLDRFGAPDDLHRILTKAHEILATCPCQSSSHPACHRCLLGVAPPDEVDIVNRKMALELLEEIFEAWEPLELATVTDIDIRKVVFSELEDRFREELKRWIDRRDSASYTIGQGAVGEELDIRLSHEGDPRRWRAIQQKEVSLPGGGTTVPDLVFERQDAQAYPVAIYLDGLQYHASVDHNITGDDARKRDRLREADYRVWSITWDDLDGFSAALDGKQPQGYEWRSPALVGPVTDKVPDGRARHAWGNPIEFLLAYLADPEADVWGQTAEETVLALLNAPDHQGESDPVLVAPSDARSALMSLVRGQNIDPGDGTLALVPRRGVSGLPLFIVGDSQGDFRASLGILAVLDDGDGHVGGPEHEKRWRGWLRWGNLLQFLTRPRMGVMHPMRMAELWTKSSLDVFAADPLPIEIIIAPDLGKDTEPLSDAWLEAIEFADSELHDVLYELAHRGIEAPEVGAEVGPQAWQIECGWHEARVAIVIDNDEERDAWLEAASWHVLHSWDHSGEGALASAVREAVEQ